MEEVLERDGLGHGGMDCWRPPAGLVQLELQYLNAVQGLFN
jgi:hypothetical protein